MGMLLNCKDKRLQFLRTPPPPQRRINISYLCFFLVQPVITTERLKLAKTQTDPLKVKQTNQSL